jgi:hypothetical protein
VHTLIRRVVLLGGSVVVACGTGTSPNEGAGVTHPNGSTTSSSGSGYYESSSTGGIDGIVVGRKYSQPGELQFLEQL